MPIELPGTYLPRILDAELEVALGSAGAVLLEGPKYCGKTWTAMRYANTMVKVDDKSDLAVQSAIDVDLGMLHSGGFRPPCQRTPTNSKPASSVSFASCPCDPWTESLFPRDDPACLGPPVPRI
jgi:hypothetical protein